jgi:flagellar motor protein MotB
VSTDLQAFALIVTAEPYAAVRQPSDVVVMENHVRPETEGIIEQVNARYELLPRGHYTWQMPENVAASTAHLPQVSTREYETLLEIYQAQNAVGIARAAHADLYAPEVLGSADSLLNQARQRHASKGDRTLILQEAREASQKAEDARLISIERERQEVLAKAQTETARARDAQVNAEVAAAQARAQADAAREAEQRSRVQAQVQVEAERAARLRAEADANAAREQAVQSQADLKSALAAKAARPPQPPQPDPREQQQLALRGRLLDSMKTSALVSRDTTRGVVSVVPESGFQGSQLSAAMLSRVRQLAATLANYRSLNIDIEAHSDTAQGEAEAHTRAQAVASVLRSSGLGVSVHDFGDTRPIGPNNTVRGREENRRIEIVVSGDSIGTRPIWQETYTLTLP